MGRLGPVTALSTDWQVIAPGDVLARIGSRYCGVGVVGGFSEVLAAGAPGWRSAVIV